MESFFPSKINKFTNLLETFIQVSSKDYPVEIYKDLDTV